MSLCFVISPVAILNVCLYMQYFYDVLRKHTQTFLLELIKRKLKVPEKNMFHQHVLNIYHWKHFQKKKKKNNRSLIMANYKLIKNNCCLRVFIQKRYHTFLDKISILTWRLLVISSQNVSCELNSFRTFSLRIISYILLQL